MYGTKLINVEYFYLEYVKSSLSQVPEGVRWGMTFFPLIFGLIFLGLIFDMELDIGNYWIMWIATSIALLLSLVVGWNKHARAIAATFFPQCFSKVGRALILSIIWSIMFNGPIHTITHNLLEARQFLKCVASQSEQVPLILQSAAFESKLQIGNQLVNKINGIGTFGEKISTTVRHLTTPIKDIQTSLKSYVPKISETAETCEQGLPNIWRNCHKDIDSANHDCRRMLGDFSPLCDLTHLGKHSCTLLNKIPFCMPLREVDNVNSLLNRINGKLDDFANMFKVQASFLNEEDLHANNLPNFGLVAAEISQEIQGWLFFINLLNVFFKVFTKILLLIQFFYVLK